MKRSSTACNKQVGWNSPLENLQYRRWAVIWASKCSRITVCLANESIREQGPPPPLKAGYSNSVINTGTLSESSLFLLCGSHAWPHLDHYITNVSFYERLTCSLWCGVYRVWGQCVGYKSPQHKHYLGYNLLFHWRQGGGSGTDLFSIHVLFNSVILRLYCPVLSCTFSDNQLVFAFSQGYVRRVNIC